MKSIRNKKYKNSTLLTYIFFILLDVFVISFLGKNMGEESVVLYTTVRLIILSLQFLVVTFKLLKACFISFKKIYLSKTEMIYEEENLFPLVKAMIPLIIILVEGIVLSEVMQYTLVSFRNILRGPSAEIILVCLILIEVLTCVISMYLSERQDSLEVM